MASFLDMVRERLSYVLSLPERSIRSLAAIAGGTTSLLTETLFPEAMRGTTLYRVFVGDAQQFIILKVAQVQQESPDQQQQGQPDPDFVRKKMIGGALEAAGLFAMHLSPLWVFAIAGDAAAGSSVFLNRLVEQLKRNGVLPKQTQIAGLTDLLGALQDASRRSAMAIDTPPLSREELAKLAVEMTASYGRMFAKAANLLPRLENLWQQMENLASRENVSIERLGGILTVDVASWARKGIGSLLAVGQAGGGLFAEQVLDSYARTLTDLAEQGVGNYVTHRMKPFLSAAAEHFDPNKKTWTDSITRAIFGARDDEAPPAPAATPDPQTGRQASENGAANLDPM